VSDRALKETAPLRAGSEVALGSYLSGDLVGEGLHEAPDAVLGDDGGVEDKLLVAVVAPLDAEAVGHQRVPVVQRVELRRDAVLVLEALIEQQLRVELQLEVVTAQVLHVVLDHDLDGLAYTEQKLDF